MGGWWCQFDLYIEWGNWAPLLDSSLPQYCIFNSIQAKYYSIYTHFRKLKDESLGLPGSGLDVVKADVIVSSVVVEAGFDAVTADIIVESGAPVSIGVI